MGLIIVLIGLITSYICWNINNNFLLTLSIISTIISFWSLGIMHNYATSAAQKRASYSGNFYDFTESEVSSVPDWITNINMISAFFIFILLMISLLKILSFNHIIGLLAIVIILLILFIRAHRKNTINQTINLLEIASNCCDAKAQFTLGSLYADGFHVKKDSQKAFELFQKSALLNNSHAQYALGLIYLEGISVKKDIDLAKAYITISANNGFENAIKLIQTLPSPSSDQEIKKQKDLQNEIQKTIDENTKKSTKK